LTGLPIASFCAAPGSFLLCYAAFTVTAAADCAMLCYPCQLSLLYIINQRNGRFLN